jgi:transposase InsO family protein
MDVQFDATADGRRLKFLNVIDEHSRFCLAIRVGRRCKAKDVVAVLEELTSLYPAPAFIRSDNGPEFIAQALRDWCEASTTTSTAYIAPGSPWERSKISGVVCRREFGKGLHLGVRISCGLVVSDPGLVVEPVAFHTFWLG